MFYYISLVGIPIALWVGAPMMGLGALYNPTIGFLVSTSIATYWLLEFMATSLKLKTEVEELQARIVELEGTQSEPA